MSSPESALDPLPNQCRDFPPTHWSLVLAAAQQGTARAEGALGQLCAAYWFPLYVYVRRRGHDPTEAEDLTRTFFARLIDKQMLGGLQAEGGKFRSFLLTMLKRFLINKWHREHAQKRGGSNALISIDASAETWYEQALVESATPEFQFERQWALTILERVLLQLGEEYKSEGKGEIFEALRDSLPGANKQLSYPEIGAALQMNEPAVRMAVHRLRRRYGELLRSEIAQTVSSADEIDEEIRHLIAVIGQK